MLNEAMQYRIFQRMEQFGRSEYYQYKCVPWSKFSLNPALIQVPEAARMPV
jgi:hypothetical protein